MKASLPRQPFPPDPSTAAPLVKRFTCLIRQALPVLEKISAELDVAVSLGTILEDEGCGLVLAHLPSPHKFSFHLTPGIRFYLHTSAPGKALMAYLPPVRLQRLLRQLRLERFNERTITDKAKLLRQLEEVRQLGYGWEMAERFEGSHCVGIPLFTPQNELLASIWIHGPSQHVPAEKFAEFAAVLHRCADGRPWSLTPVKRSGAGASVKPLVEKAVRLLESNLHAAVDLEAFAASQHVSYTWFRRLFKRQTGISPHQYQLALRMNQAESLLRKGDLTVSEISTRLGFESPYYFSRLFKLKHGRSPSEYRLKPRGKRG